MKIKKLKLNKETVVNLDGKEMDQLKGGGSDGVLCVRWTIYTRITCPDPTPTPKPTPPDSDCCGTGPCTSVPCGDSNNTPSPTPVSGADWCTGVAC